MAAVFGENALIYLGASHATLAVVPLANEWSVDVEQNKVESPAVFACPPAAANSWITKTGGKFSASGSISALYDDATYAPITLALAGSSVVLYIYPNCSVTGRYWWGTVWTQISHSGSAEDYITLDISWESTGQFIWHGA